MIGNQKGFSLVEVLIASMLLAMIFMGAVAANSSAYQAIKKVETSGDKDDIIASVLDNLRADPNLYQSHFDIVDPSALAWNNLPLAWGEGEGIYDVKDCPDCPGRLGYTISPLNVLMPGVYIVRVRIAHPTIFGEDKGYKDYEFITASQ